MYLGVCPPDDARALREGPEAAPFWIPVQQLRCDVVLLPGVGLAAASAALARGSRIEPSVEVSVFTFSRHFVCLFILLMAGCRVSAGWPCVPSAFLSLPRRAARGVGAEPPSPSVSRAIWCAVRARAAHTLPMSPPPYQPRRAAAAAAPATAAAPVVAFGGAATAKMQRRPWPLFKLYAYRGALGSKFSACE